MHKLLDVRKHRWDKRVAMACEHKTCGQKDLSEHTLFELPFDIPASYFPWWNKTNCDFDLVNINWC
jgi:hypothetical protein